MLTYKIIKDNYGYTIGEAETGFPVPIWAEDREDLIQLIEDIYQDLQHPDHRDGYRYNEENDYLYVDEDEVRPVDEMFR